MQNILVQGVKSAIVVKTEDMVKGLFRPYLLANYVLFDPNTDFRPVGGGQQAHPQYREFFKENIQDAEKLFNEECKLFAGSEKQETRHPLWDELCDFYKLHKHVYIYGPAGTGKSYVVQQLAKHLNVPFHQSGCVGETWELLGSTDAHGNYQPTEFYNSFKEGGIFLLDEMDGCDDRVLVAINNVLSNGRCTFPNGETLEKKEDWVVFATGNTNGHGATIDYNSRSKLDISTLDRFIVLPFYYDNSIELLAAQGDSSMVDFFHGYRKACKKLGVHSIATYRSLDLIAVFSKKGYDLKHLIDICLIKGINIEDVEAIYNEVKYNIDNNNKYLTALYDYIKEAKDNEF